MKMATFIVEKRNLFFLLYVFAIIFCLFSMSWVQVENDVTTYLSDDTETKQGLTVMNDNFVAFGTARVMVSNITYETAEEILDILTEIDGVDMVTFDDSEAHFRNATALYDVNFGGGAMEADSIRAMEEIREKLGKYDLSIDSLVGYDENALLDQEMTTILIVAVIIILVVLTLTSRSYAEVPVLLITFGIAALLSNLLMEKSVLQKDLPFLVGITALWAIFIFIGWDISNIEGIVLLVILLKQMKTKSLENISLKLKMLNL